MKLRQSELDSAVYVIACILSCGIVWVMRVIISAAIRKAVQD